MKKFLSLTWKYNELIFILLGIAMSAIYIYCGNKIEAFTFAYEKLGKVVFGIAMYFIVEGINRVHFIAQYKRLYRYFDSSFKENKEWDVLPESQRPWLAVVLFVGRLIAMTILISAL